MRDLIKIVLLPAAILYCMAATCIYSLAGAICWVYQDRPLRIDTAGMIKSEWLSILPFRRSTQ